MSGHNERIIDSVDGGNQATSGAPGLLMGIQYSKNVTFQVLNAPAVYTRVQDRPHVAIAVDVSAHQLGENQPTFEVELILRCQGQTNSTNGEKPVALFEANLVYAAFSHFRTPHQKHLNRCCWLKPRVCCFPVPVTCWQL